MIPSGIRLFGLGLTLTLATVAEGLGDEQTVKLADCPAEVRKTLELEAKGAKIEAVNKQTEAGETAYWVRVVLGGRTYQVRVDPNGLLIEIELEVTEAEVKFANCPAAVQATFRREAKDAKFDEIARDIKYGVVIYEAVATINGKDYAIVVAENGTLVEKMLVVAEDEIELSHCPAAVQHAMKDHARGGKIGPIMRSTGIGGHVYESELEIAGEKYFLEVTEGGGLISKTLLVDEKE